MPREIVEVPSWAEVGKEYAYITYHSGVGAFWSVGAEYTIIRKTKTKVVAEFKASDNRTVTKEFVAQKERLYSAGRWSGDKVILSDKEKYGHGELVPVDSKQLANIKNQKLLDINMRKAQAQAAAFGKRNSNHLHTADLAQIIFDLNQTAEERLILEQDQEVIDNMKPHYAE